MTKDSAVWISRILVDTTLFKAFASDVFLADKERTLETIERYKRGEPLSADRYPKEMYGRYRDRKEKAPPHVFMAASFWQVRADCAEVLRGADLGQTALYPVKLFQHDRTTPVEGAYFCLAFGETKDSFVPEMSTRVDRDDPTKELWRLSFGPLKDEDIAVTEQALAGVDLWIEKRLSHAVFLSDRLAGALRRAKLARRFGLHRCRIIPLQ